MYLRFSFFALPYICSNRADSSCFHLHILFLFDHGMISVGMSFTSPPSFKLMSVPKCAARKMFPKRKLDESRSGSESQKEEAEANEEQGQLNKRPRVETTANSAGTPSPLLLHQSEIENEDLQTLQLYKPHYYMVKRVKQNKATHYLIFFY